MYIHIHNEYVNVLPYMSIASDNNISLTHSSGDTTEHDDDDVMLQQFFEFELYYLLRSVLFY